MSKGKKPRKKTKRIAYIDVEDIENNYLDTALLQVYNEATIPDVISDELKILKKAGVRVQDIKQDKYTGKELVALISPYLLENYNFYNHLANMWDEIQTGMLRDMFDEDIDQYASDEWDTELSNMIEDAIIPAYAAVNLLRFYKNGAHKHCIKPILEEFAIEFYRETGVQYEGADVDWEEVEDDEFDLSFDDINLEDHDSFEKQFMKKMPDEALRLAANLIDGVAERISGMNETLDYKEIYEKEKEQREQFQLERDTSSQELKSKESQLASLQKERNTLAKKVDILENKVDTQQKETGRLGQALGELRKEKEEAEKANTALERKVATIEKEQEKLEEKAQKAAKLEYDQKMVAMQMDHDSKVETLERERDAAQGTLEETKTQYDSLSSEHDNAKKELETLKNDLFVVEKERNELMEKLENANKTPVKVPPEQEEEDDDLLSGFDEDDIGSFIDFDNEPTRS